MEIQEYLNCDVQRGLTLRMKIILFGWFLMSFAVLTFPENFNEQIPLLGFIIIVNMVILIYRKIIIKKIKLKSTIYINEAKIVLKTPIFQKEIEISDVKMLGYRLYNKKNIDDITTGDLIINLTALRLDYLYWYNLIFNQSFLDESSTFKPFIVPDLKNVENIYNYIIQKKGINVKEFKKIGYSKNSELQKYNNNILIKNKNSELLYCDNKRFKIITYKNLLRIKLKHSFLSQGGIIMEDYELPDLEYIKI